MEATSHLFGLSLELRHCIYDYVIGDCLAKPLPSPEDDLQGSRLDSYLSLLKVNRQLHDELESCLLKYHSDELTLSSHHGGLSALLAAAASAPAKIYQNASFYLRCPAGFSQFRISSGLTSERAIRMEHRPVELMLVDQAVFPNTRSAYSVIVGSYGVEIRSQWHGVLQEWDGRIGRLDPLWPDDGWFLPFRLASDPERAEQLSHYDGTKRPSRTPNSLTLTAYCELRQGLPVECWVLEGKLRDLRCKSTRIEDALANEMDGVD